MSAKIVGWLLIGIALASVIGGAFEAGRLHERRLQLPPIHMGETSGRVDK